MKYADSFSHREIISATGTTYSEWFPVGFANELYMYTDSTMDVAGTLSIVTTVERFVPYRTPAHATIATFTAITAAATESSSIISCANFFTPAMKATLSVIGTPMSAIVALI